ncbi:protein kinase 4 isoform X2 [Maniola jurtina]|uniref:protein kinase 4 isoform X2 n=1 Tax=Maniola jurtina TaxID=191418 RepID=UPI001E68D81A|nr:protein kinase 4 isoform X2 [Maniola jurtina]
MPLFSDHISNMYYSGSSAYTSSPYSYSSAASPFGSSYSASYLNPGGSYSSHSSLGGYSRAPLSSRWLTSGGRAYSPMLSPISEKGTSSPVRINSPRRIPISGRSYVPSTYTSRPININTADIDVSRDKYRKKLLSSNSTTPTGLPPRRESPLTNKENGHDKPDTGIDTSPGPRRSTIKRDRAVVRLHTVKRKERDSPRKPLEAPNKATNNDSPKTENQTESKKWREKLADDLAYKTQKETKSLGAKLVEKFTLKEKVDDEHDNCTKISPKTLIDDEKSSVQLNNDDVITFPNKSVDRRCSMELLAEQASLLDSLIRRENLSTASLDLSKVGANDNLTTDINLEPKDTKIRKLSHQENRLTTTQSDHSLHDLLASKDNKEQIFSKRRSLRKCSSGDNIRKLDCIKEIPKKAKALNLLPAEEKIDMNKILKPKIKTKITSTVEVTSTTPQLKFFVENVTVEETSRPCKKDIIFSSRVDENPLNEISTEIEGRRKSVKLKKQVKPQADIQEDTSMKKVDHNNGKDKNLPNVNLQTTKGHRKSIKSKIKDKSTPLEDTGNLTSPEPEDGNFWEKIGKRETIYLIQRKQNLEEAKERSKRLLFWFPEEETCDIDTEKNEIVDKPLFKEVTNANCVETIKEAKKICTPRKENEIINAPINKLEGKINTKIDIHDKKLTNTSTVKDINYSEVIENTSSSSHVKTNENILNDKKVVATPDFIKSEKSNLNMRMCKTSKSEKNSENDNTCINNLRDINNQYAEDIEKSKVVLNKNTAEDTKSVTKSKDGKKSNIGNQNKSLNKENVSKNQNISVPQANSMNDLKETLSINKTSKSGENNKKENNYVNNSKDINNQGIEFTEDMEKSKVTLNKGISEDTKNITKSKDSKKSNIDERKKSLNKEQSIENQNVIIPEANLIDHLKETSSISNEKESNNISSTSQPNLTQDLITIEQKHVISSDIGHETNLKDEFEKVRTIPIENNAELSPDTAIIDVSKNNIPEKKTIEFPINKSSKETDENNGITEIFEIKAEQPDVVSTSSNSPKEASVIIENTDMENKKDGKVEAAKTDDKIKNSNLLVDQDNKILLKENDINIEEKSTSNSQIQKNETTETETKPEITDKPVSSTDALQVFSNKKPAKEEKALKTLIATPRPLQKRNPQTIRSSSSSSESSDDDSSEDTEEDGHEDQGESGSSHGSAEYRECENNPDGRTSTGSADSGFDSSAPTSPSGFLHAKKGGDNPSTSAGATPPQTFTHDVLEQELEHSTAYDLFRKTGRFTPPARTIPRFRKYTIEDFQFIRVLGKGSFGKVMLAELRGTEYYYAVKCLKKDVVLEDDDVECTLIERKVLALGTNHPYLCHLFATFQTDSHLFFVMEYLNGGDLMFHIQQSGRFPEVRARFYAAEIVSGLKFLHKRGIVYRDLKLDNILLDFDGHVRIADFGMCKLQIYLDKTADTFCGTPDYMAPEIIKGLKYNQTVDWWSFGVLLYEMLIGQSPFSGCDEDELFWSICNEMPSYPRFLSPESLSILTRLLDKDAKTRLGGPECMHGDIRDQKFFEQIQWDRLERRELEAPFKPRVRHPMDTQYFDRAFTGERPRLTAVEPQVLRSMDQEPFRGFSYTNPNATDR